MLGRHLNEFLRAARNGHFEVTPTGLYFPQQKVKMGGVMGIAHQKGPWNPEEAAWDETPNLIVAQGRTYEQTVALLGGGAQANWYIAPFAANVAPADNLTAATFATVQTEFTNYTEPTRQAWVKNAAGSVGGTTSNSDSPAVITIGNGAQVNIYGGGLISVSAKSGVTGILYAAVLATKAKTGLDEGDTIGFKYTIALTSS